MIARTLKPKLVELADYYPVVAVTGPRQSGKTTLCRSTFSDHRYVSLEASDQREFALEDPRGFLAEYRNGAIIDEVQRAPDLLSYLQGEVDERPAPGRFILTGSQHFGLSDAISQSLAGRCGTLVLLPPDFSELQAFDEAPDELFQTLWQGAYPRPYDRHIPHHQWLADYVSTYIERDVRQVINIGDLQTFSGFLKLCAGRTAQEINLSALGGDAGISHNTARAWLSVLETSYIIQRLPAWHTNVRKQVVKAPKLHFIDSGLACYLLGIREPEQLKLHPLRGAVFESWVVSEMYKAPLHHGQRPALFHYREARGLEVDLVVDHGDRIDAIETKSGATASSAFFKQLKRFTQRMAEGDTARTVNSTVVYGGEAGQRRSYGRLLPWRQVPKLFDP